MFDKHLCANCGGGPVVVGDTHAKCLKCGARYPLNETVWAADNVHDAVNEGVALNKLRSRIVFNEEADHDYSDKDPKFIPGCPFPS